MDYAAIRKHLLITLRGSLSQTQLNRKLGFTFNQIYRWESGAAKISWLDFLRLASARKIDMAEALKKTFNFRRPPERYDLLIHHLIGNSKLASVARNNDVSTFRIRRWLNGTTPPDLEEVLSLIDRHAHVLIVFIGHIANVRSIPPLKKEFERRELEIKLLREYPVSGAVLRALELKEYQDLPQHLVGWVAQKLGISKAEEILIIEGLTKAELIVQKKKKYLVLSRAFDPQGDLAATIALRIYWLERTRRFLAGLSVPSSRDIPIGQMVFSCSSEAWEKMLEKYMEFFAEIRVIIADDKLPPDQIRVMGVQLLDVSKI